ncbi:MAG: hypothetical protein IKX97_04795, partial [Erysipelotrichaceae bacterium]|nr:hypothetical protein [Erysipelotrichaceae bacterium]
FTSEGLDRYLDTLLGYLDELADALEEGSEAAIEQAKQAIADFFDEKGSVIVDTLLYRYTGYTLEDIYIKLENVQLLEPYVDRMDTIISLVGANPEFCDMFAKSALTYFINTSLKGYMNDYLQAMIGGNQETIDSTRAALETFLAQQSTKDTIHLIELITGEELQSRIDDVMENTTEESLSDFISYATQTVAIYVNDYYPESLTPSSVLPALQSVSEILHQALDLSNNFTMDNYDDLRDALDILLEDETICLIMQMIDYKYGFNFFEIAGNIQDGTYIEIVRYQARLYIELLKNSSDFINELGKAAIVQMLERYDDALNQLEDKIREKDLRSAFETFKFIVTMLSQDDFSLLRQLIINYFDRTIVIDFSQIIPPDKLDALLEKLDELADVIRQFRDLEKRISDGEKRLEQGKNELAAGYAAYYEGLALLEEKEKLLNSSAFQIRDARRQLEEKRQEAYSALQKAKDELASARKEADEAIEKGREELLNRSCNWVIQDRESNASYIDSRGPINGAYGSSKSFGALFLMVISLVCFSTIAIIVEEEKKSVGTTKAFGFYNREILAKYLIFGVTAAVIGSLLGVVLGLVICRIVLNVFASGEIYAVGGYTMKTSPLSMIL